MDSPTGFKKWYILFRVWSLSAAAVPVLVGTVWAGHQGYFNPWLFGMTLLGGMALQVGTNLINTYYDYKTGVDTIELTKTCPCLVEGWMEATQVKRLGLVCFSLVALMGIYLVYLRGWPILILGLLGIWGGYSYTGGFAYKYKGLGSILVFFLMGPLMVWASYYVQTGIFAWSPILVSLPIGFLVAAILNANDLRDLSHDARAGIKTLPLLIGYRNGFIVQYLLYAAAFLSVILVVFIYRIPPVVLLPVLLAVPGGLKMFKHSRLAFAEHPVRKQLLEMESARFHAQFGLVFAGGLLMGLFIA